MLFSPTSAQESALRSKSCHRYTDGDRRDHPECQSTKINSISKCPLIEEKADGIVYLIIYDTIKDLIIIYLIQKRLTNKGGQSLPVIACAITKDTSKGPFRNLVSIASYRSTVRLSW